MTKSHIDLDDEALAGAAELYGTRTTEDTVNAALREAAQQAKRRRALDRFAEMGAEGDFDILLDKRNYRR